MKTECSSVSDFRPAPELVLPHATGSETLLRQVRYTSLPGVAYDRRPLLDSQVRRDRLLAVLEQMRNRYPFAVSGYVVMPKKAHVLVSEPRIASPSRAAALEERLPVELGKPAEVVTHLESLEDHERAHSTERCTGRPE